MGIAELRRSVEQPGGETVRTVPLLERNNRQRQQATRLSGVETEAEAFNNHEAFSMNLSFKGKALNTTWFKRALLNLLMLCVTKQPNHT